VLCIIKTLSFCLKNIPADVFIKLPQVSDSKNMQAGTKLDEFSNPDIAKNVFKKYLRPNPPFQK